MTAAPMNDQAELGQPEPDMITVTLPLQVANALETAICDLPYLVLDVQRALSGLESALVGGHLDGNDAAPMLSLFARALTSVEATEGKALKQFDPLLRRGLSRFYEARRLEEIAEARRRAEGGA